MQKGSIIRSTFSIWHDVIIKSKDYTEKLNHKTINLKKQTCFILYSRNSSVYRKDCNYSFLFDTCFLRSKIKVLYVFAFVCGR